MWIHVQMTWRLLNTLTYATIMSVLRTLRHMCNVILAKTCQHKTCKHPMLLWTYIVYMWQFKIVIIYCIYIHMYIYIYEFWYGWMSMDICWLVFGTPKLAPVTCEKLDPYFFFFGGGVLQFRHKKGFQYPICEPWCWYIYLDLGEF